MESETTLFDEPEEWHEVPQARYLSWSLERQLSYCAMRDEDSARRDPEFASFYTQRAQLYREMIDGK